jgi:hypothetical protein
MVCRGYRPVRFGSDGIRDLAACGTRIVGTETAISTLRANLKLDHGAPLDGCREPPI